MKGLTDCEAENLRDMQETLRCGGMLNDRQFDEMYRLEKKMDYHKKKEEPHSG
jgi:hypothetical protein